MNIKIEQKGLRFKITDHELQSLLKGESVQTIIKIGYIMMCIQVFTHHCNSETSCSLTVDDANKVSLTLNVSQEDLQQLRDMGRNRFGLHFQQDNLPISIQVDIRKQSREGVTFEKRVLES